MFSVIFLSKYKYFLIKILNIMKDDHLHALNDSVYYLLNIDQSKMLYISIIFIVFKVVFIVCFIKHEIFLLLIWQSTVASNTKRLGCLLGMDEVCGNLSVKVHIFVFCCFCHPQRPAIIDYFFHTSLFSFSSDVHSGGIVIFQSTVSLHIGTLI